MKKTADNIRIIGKSDGPTSVFIAGKDKKKTLRQKIEKSMYDFRRKRVIKFLRADSHSVDEVADYVVRELGYIVCMCIICYRNAYQSNADN